MQVNCPHPGVPCAGNVSDDDVLERELAAEQSQKAFHASAKAGEKLQDLDR